METKDMGVISSFLLAFKKDGPSKALENIRLGDEGSIEERPDAQLDICAAVLSLYKNDSSDLAMRSFLAIRTIDGAAEFAFTFLEYLSAISLDSETKMRTQQFKRDGVLNLGPRDLKLISDNLHAFKKELSKKIENHGGVTALAKKLKMSQPSLSKMLNSEAIPRITTLEKIYEELGISEIILKKEV